MRAAAEIGLRAGVFVTLWLIWPDAAAPPPDGGGGGWLLFVVLAVVAFLWGLIDGLVARETFTSALLRWAATAPVVAVTVPVLGGVTEGSWPAGVDLLRWVVALTLMLYFLLVLPAGLGVALGSSVQGLGRWVPRG
jgi:hypothetical protein